MSLQDLEIERHEVEGLVALSGRVLARDQDSKFTALRSTLLDERFRGQKLIVFTEHRDTLTWLRQQLEALGFTDRIAAIHGGMDFRQREVTVERFRLPVDEGGAQYLLATDAAGEGINLQDLTEILPGLLRVAAGHELSFGISVGLKGAQRPKDDVVKAVNELLKQVSDGFEVI